MELQTGTNRIYALDAQGRLLAEVTYPLVAEGVVDINHTFVDESLRGQGVAGRLLQAAVSDICARGLRLRASCSYAKSWLERHPEHSVLLV